MKNRLIVGVMLFATLATFRCSTVSESTESLQAFEKTLNEIISSRDRDALRSILHETVFESNDGCGYPGCPKDQFLNMYFSPGAVEDWNMLADVVGEGFIEVGRDSAIVQVENADVVYEAPKYKRQINTSTQVMVLSETAEIKEGPDTSTQTIGYLARNETLACACCMMNRNHDIYRNSKGEEWVRIKYKELFGYVAGRNTSQRPAKVLGIALINNQWRIVSWYTGECG